MANYQREPDVYKEEFATALWLITDNLLSKFKFKNIERGDAISEGVMIGIAKAHRFDPSKGKAFNFFTTVILNHCRQLWRTEANYARLKAKLGEKLKWDTPHPYRRHG